MTIMIFVLTAALIIAAVTLIFFADKINSLKNELRVERNDIYHLESEIRRLNKEVYDLKCPPPKKDYAVERMKQLATQVKHETNKSLKQSNIVLGPTNTGSTNNQDNTLDTVVNTMLITNMINDDDCTKHNNHDYTSYDTHHTPSHCDTSHTTDHSSYDSSSSSCDTSSYDGGGGDFGGGGSSGDY